MGPQATAGGRCGPSLSVLLLKWQLRLGDAFCSSCNDSPLLDGGEKCILVLQHHQTVSNIIAFHITNCILYTLCMYLAHDKC